MEADAVSLYIDTSALLKLFFVEPESARMVAIVSQEPQIFISSLARLEALTQVRSRVAGGVISLKTEAALITQIESRLASAPFELHKCPASLIDVAEKQIASSQAYCPTLDRLHLAAMEIFKVRRLLTNDDVQANAARALGFEVILPR